MGPSRTSEPALLLKRIQPSTNKLTLLLLKPKQLNTKPNLPAKLKDGRLKSLNGSQMLKLLLPKRSHVLFQRLIAELNQPKMKLLLSNKNSEPKLKVGSTLKKKNFSLMLQPSKAESFHQLTHGRLTPSLTSEKSRNDSTLVLLLRSPRLPITKNVFKQE